MASMFKFIQPFQLTGSWGETDTACNRHSVYSKLMMNRIGAELQYNSYLFRNNLFSDLSTDEFVAKKAI